MPQAVVARVLGKKSGINNYLKEFGGALAGESGAKALGVADGALAVAGVDVLRLADAGIVGDAEEGDGVERVFHSEPDFVVEGEDAELRAGNVVRRLGRFAVEAAAECAEDFLVGAFIVLPAHHRSGLYARRRCAGSGLLRRGCGSGRSSLRAEGGGAGGGDEDESRGGEGAFGGMAHTQRFSCRITVGHISEENLCALEGRWTVSKGFNLRS